MGCTIKTQGRVNLIKYRLFWFRSYSCPPEEDDDDDDACMQLLPHSNLSNLINCSRAAIHKLIQFVPLFSLQAPHPDSGYATRRAAEAGVARRRSRVGCWRRPISSWNDRRGTLWANMRRCSRRGHRNSMVSWVRL